LPESVTFTQSISPPPGSTGTAYLVVHKSGAEWYSATVSIEDAPFDVVITGYPDDMISVYFDGALTWGPQSVAAILQHQQ
jgi:hypothetical protein